VIGRWRRQPLWLRAGVLLLLTVLAVAGVELWARGQAPQLPGWSRQVSDGTLMNGHPTRLWGMREGVQHNAGATATINRLGLRGPVPEVPRPAGRERILILGDSSFFGHGVGDRDTLAAQLGARLRARGLDVDVVNAAVAGYSVVQSRLLMDEVGWGLQPTLVVYANVWSDNTFDAFRDEDLIRSRRVARLNPLVHSAAFRLLASRLARERVVVWRPEDGWPQERVRRVPLDRFSALHDALVREGAARGAGALFIQPTNRELLELDPRIENGPRAPDRFWKPYFQVFAALGACHGAPQVALTPPFRSALDRGRQMDDLFLDMMHPTPLGQGIVAAQVDAALQAAGWPGRDLVGAGQPCDTSHIVDVPTPEWFSGDGAESPQRLLFLDP